MSNGPFEGPFSTMDNPRLEFALEVRLAFPRAQMIASFSPVSSRACFNREE